jgi:hypothetical protein
MGRLVHTVLGSSSLRSTCPPLSSPPHVNSFVIGPAVIKHTVFGETRKKKSQKWAETDRRCAAVPTHSHGGGVGNDDLCDDDDERRTHSNMKDDKLSLFQQTKPFLAIHEFRDLPSVSQSMSPRYIGCWKGFPRVGKGDVRKQGRDRTVYIAQCRSETVF